MLSVKGSITASTGTTGRLWNLVIFPLWIIYFIHLKGRVTHTHREKKRKRQKQRIFHSPDHSSNSGKEWGQGQVKARKLALHLGLRSGRQKPKSLNHPSLPSHAYYQGDGLEEGQPGLTIPIWDTAIAGGGLSEYTRKLAPSWCSHQRTASKIHPLNKSTYIHTLVFNLLNLLEIANYIKMNKNFNFKKCRVDWFVWRHTHTYNIQISWCTHKWSLAEETKNYSWERLHNLSLDVWRKKKTVIMYILIF